MPSKYSLTVKKSSISQGFVTRSSGNHTPFRTGFTMLDNELGGGLEPAQVHLLCAQPGTGKTSFGINVGLSVLSEGRPVVFVNSELPEIDFVARLINIKIGELEWRHIKNGLHNNIVDRELDSLSGGLLHIVSLPDMMAGDNSLQTVIQEIADDTGQIPLVVVDYLQQMATRFSPDMEYRHAVDSLSTALIQIAHSTGACVLAISSVARNKYNGKRQDVLSMGKESGQLEFDAATVIGMIEGRVYVDDDNVYRKMVEVVIGKNRFYKMGVGVDMSLMGAVGKFEETMATIGESSEDMKNRTVAFIEKWGEANITTIRNGITGNNTEIANIVKQLVEENRIVVNDKKFSIPKKEEK